MMKVKVCLGKGNTVFKKGCITCSGYYPRMCERVSRVWECKVCLLYWNKNWDWGLRVLRNSKLEKKLRDDLILLLIHLLQIIQAVYVVGSKHCPSSLFSSVQFSRSVVSDSSWPHGLQHARPPCPSKIPRVFSNSCPLSRWCHPTISSSLVSPPAFNLSQHQGLFQWVSSLCQVAKVLEFQLQHQSSLLL